LESGFGSTTDLPVRVASLAAPAGSPEPEHQKLQEGTDELEGRVASDYDLLHGRPSRDHSFMAGHCRWLLDNGCSGIVALGSLGEGATLSCDEKLEVLRTCVEAVHGRGPVVASSRH